MRLFYQKILCPSCILFKRFLKIKTYLFTSLKPQLFLLNLAHIPNQSGIFGSSLERSRSSIEILNQNLMQIGRGVIENKQKTEIIFVVIYTLLVCPFTSNKRKTDQSQQF